MSSLVAYSCDTTNGGTSNTSSPSSSTPTHSTSGLHIGAAVGAASAIASTIIAHSPNNSSISNCSNNNQIGNNGTYQRHTLTQSQLLSYTPPNPHKFRLTSFSSSFEEDLHSFLTHKNYNKNRIKTCAYIVQKTVAAFVSEVLGPHCGKHCNN
uniref:Uncharacterized protein n=1 Tax=Glossina pallidipes TaxID=7398 RepID=A0A1B0AHN5_GLOPL